MSAVRARLKQLGLEAGDIDYLLLSHLQEGITGVRVIRAFVRDETRRKVEEAMAALDNRFTYDDSAVFTFRDGDEFWQMDDEALGELCVETLKPIIPGVRERYEGCRVLKTPIAYPVFLREYEAERRRFAEGTGVENLYSVGRNGEFMHIFMEDVHHRTEKKMRELARLLEGAKTKEVSASTGVSDGESVRLEAALPVGD